MYVRDTCERVRLTYLSIRDFIFVVWEWISSFALHFIMDMITYPCKDLS